MPEERQAYDAGQEDWIGQWIRDTRNAMQKAHQDCNEKIEEWSLERAACIGGMRVLDMLAQEKARRDLGVIESVKGETAQ